jgi:hypothetical protein
VIDSKKTLQDLYFYFWIGIVLYVSGSVLDIIHLYQSKGRVPIDFSFYLVLLSLNISLLSKLKDLSNLARRLFIIKFILFACFFYPQMLGTPSGGWAYSGHWPHGMFQRVAHMSAFVFELFLTLHLIKRSIRFVFAHRDDDDIKKNIQHRELDS